jgi:hypothetical protein
VLDFIKNDNYYPYTGTKNMMKTSMKMDIDFVISRSRNMHIENRPPIDILLRYDNQDTMFYVDPPLVMFNLDMKRELVGYLKNVKSKVVLVGLLIKDWHVVSDNLKICQNFQPPKHMINLF